MRRNTGFQHGAGNVFTCEDCGRRTRKTRENPTDGYCFECYELAGLYNALTDNGEEAFREDGYVEERDALLAAIVAKGGNGERVKEINAELFAVKLED